MDRTLDVTIFRGIDNRPWATVHNFPGLDADMSSEQMRAMAAALVVASEKCEELPAQVQRKHLSFDLSRKAV